MAGEHCCSQEPAVLLRCVHSHGAGKKKLTVKLSPADFPVSCSGKSLLLLWSNPLIFSKNEIKWAGIPPVVKWILAQTLLTKIFQALAVLHLDLRSISGNASTINELVLILPPRLMFWEVLRQYRCLFFKGTEYPNSLPQKRAPSPSTEHPNLHPPGGESGSDSHLLCVPQLVPAIASKPQYQAAYRLCTKGSKGEKQLSHGKGSCTHTRITTGEIVLYSLCTLVHLSRARVGIQNQTMHKKTQPALRCVMELQFLFLIPYTIHFWWWLGSSTLLSTAMPWGQTEWITEHILPSRPPVLPGLPGTLQDLIAVSSFDLKAAHSSWHN